MKKLVRFVFLIPLAIVLILLSVANRHSVTLSLDPLNAETPAIAYDLPVFVLVFLVFVVGLLLGGFMVWASQGKHRRALREKDFEVHKMKRDQENTKATQPVAEIAPGLPMVSRG